MPVPYKYVMPDLSIIGGKKIIKKNEEIILTSVQVAKTSKPAPLNQTELF